MINHTKEKVYEIIRIKGIWQETASVRQQGNRDGLSDRSFIPCFPLSPCCVYCVCTDACFCMRYVYTVAFTEAKHIQL